MTNWDILDVGNGEAVMRGAVNRRLQQQYDAAVKSRSATELARVRGAIRRAAPADVFSKSAKAVRSSLQKRREVSTAPIDYQTQPGTNGRRVHVPVTSTMPVLKVSNGYTAHSVQVGGRRVRVGHNIQERLITIDGVQVDTDTLPTTIGREFTSAVQAYSAAEQASEDAVIKPARERIQSAVSAVVLSQPFRDAAIRAVTRREVRTNI